MLAAMKEIINPDVVIHYDTAKKQLKLKEDGADSKVATLYIEHTRRCTRLYFGLSAQKKQTEI